MKESLSAWQHLERLVWEDVLLVIAILVATRLVVLLVQWVLRRAAQKVSPQHRLTLLRIIPIARLLIRLSAIVLVVPILVEPTFRNVITLMAGIALGLAYTLKDYGSSAIAGIVTVLENTYQPGDWIEIDGTYGEVKSISGRAVRLVTADDTEVIIPHSRLWSTSVANASSGSRSILCVADFYLHPEHDGEKARQRLMEIAESSSFRAPETKVTVIAHEKPWGTHYRVKVYVTESREQFLLTTDVTIRGKEALRDMNIRFAQAPYAVSSKSLSD
jgi:small-conductance mechanosensitive channel